MTERIATAAATDWRATEANFWRRFPTEFARDTAAVQFQLLNLNAPPPEAAEGAVERALESPALRAHLKAMLERATVVATTAPPDTDEMEPGPSAPPSGL